MINFYSCIRPLIFKMDAECAHALTINFLKLNILPPVAINPDPVLAVSCLGKTFRHPLGLAAGFDKNADALPGCFNLGFSFVEAGTVTPYPQEGNPRPRIFRDVETESVINRMGFPGRGLDYFSHQLKAFRQKNTTAIVGANIGMNKDAPDAAAAYIAGLNAVAADADYVAINISSPNTPGLRGLQNKAELNELLSRVMTAHATITNAPPVVLKVAPDLTFEQKEDIARIVLEQKIHGLIVSNTTLARPEVLSPALREERGGLSGRLLTDISTQAIGDFYRLTGGQLPIIGVGGISSAEDAYAKIKAGASLLQLYTALVFQGPTIIPRIITRLTDLLKKDGHATLTSAVGSGQN